jgi:hypothetical protein
MFIFICTDIKKTFAERYFKYLFGDTLIYRYPTHFSICHSFPDNYKRGFNETSGERYSNTYSARLSGGYAAGIRGGNSTRKNPVHGSQKRIAVK